MAGYEQCITRNGWIRYGGFTCEGFTYEPASTAAEQRSPTLSARVRAERACVSACQCAGVPVCRCVCDGWGVAADTILANQHESLGNVLLTCRFGTVVVVNQHVIR